MNKTEHIWLITDPTHTFKYGRIFESKHQAEEEIKWDRALSGCIVIPATLTY